MAKQLPILCEQSYKQRSLLKTLAKPTCIGRVGNNLTLNTCCFATDNFKITNHTIYKMKTQSKSILDWIDQCFTSPPTQYRLYGRRFLQVKRPNQQYQSTEGTNKYTYKSNIQ